MHQREQQPWLLAYPPGLGSTLDIGAISVVEAWKDRVSANPDRPALKYFDGSLSAADVDRASSALAAALASRGSGPGDRVGIYLQNIPQYALALLALWKLGAIAVLLNPMYRRGELRTVTTQLV